MNFYFEKCCISLSQLQIRAFDQILFVHNDYRFLCLSASQCRQPPAFKATYGKIQSPRYPEPYLPNQLKHWHLRTHKGFQIRLSLSHLDIKASPGCSQDSLTVRVILTLKRPIDCYTITHIVFLDLNVEDLHNLRSLNEKNKPL